MKLVNYLYINVLNVAYNDGASNTNARIHPVFAAALILGFSVGSLYLSIVSFGPIIQHVDIPRIHKYVVMVLSITTTGILYSYYLKNDRYLADYYNLKKSNKLLSRSKAAALALTLMVGPSLLFVLAAICRDFL